MSGPDLSCIAAGCRPSFTTRRRTVMRNKIVFVCLALVLSVGSSAAVAAQSSAGPAATTAARIVVNLNSATADQLASLPGIGERTAQRIIEYRQKNGPFKKAEDLMNIRGIGEKSFLRLKDLVTITPPKAERPPSGSQ
jgi:comEA protein